MNQRIVRYLNSKWSKRGAVSMSACARPRLGHTLGRTLGQGLVEDRDGGVDLLAGHSHWRRDAKDVGRGTPSDVQACSELQATSAHCEAELARGGSWTDGPLPAPRRAAAPARGHHRWARGAAGARATAPYIYVPSSRARSERTSRTMISTTLAPTDAGSGSAAWVV